MKKKSNNKFNVNLSLKRISTPLNYQHPGNSIKKNYYNSNNI